MKLGILTLGCPKNEADDSILKGYLVNAGFEVVENTNEADGVIINTCGFILSAQKEAIDEILDFVEYKKTNPNFKIFVKGCLVQRFSKELKKEIPEVDGWFGIVTPKELISNLKNEVFLVHEPQPIYSFENRKIDSKPYSYIKIADGCNRNCSFCTIPSFKGTFKSREMNDILDEARFLIKNGKRELILVAQDTTAYGEDIYGEQSLPALLKLLTHWMAVFL